MKNKVEQTASEPQYKVYKLMRVSGRRKILEKNLTLDEAKRVVNRYPDSSRSMVCFTKMQNNHY